MNIADTISKRVIVQNTFSAIYMVQSKQGDKIFQVPTIKKSDLFDLKINICALNYALNNILKLK